MPLLAALAVGCLLSLLAFELARQLEHERANSEFAQVAADQFSVLQRRLEHNFDVLLSLSGLLSHGQVEAQEYRAFVRPFMARFPSLRQVGWAPAQDGDLHVPTAPTASEAAAALDRSFVLTFSERRRAALIATGSDLRDSPVLAPLLLEALMHEGPAVGHAPDGRGGHLLIWIQAVYAIADAPNEDRTLLGFLFGGHEIGTLVEVALAALTPRGVDLEVRDVAAPGPPLFWHDAQARLPLPVRRPAYALPPIEEIVTIGNQEWRVTATATAAFVPGADGRLPWVLLTGGLMFTLLLGIYVHALSRQSERYMRMVAQLEQEVHERQRAEQQLAKLAHHDALTGLANRALFSDRVEQALAHAARTGERLALFYLDLDGFKTLNDTLGHEQGDVALREVARRLAGAGRAEDTVARLGGDEFTILFRELKTPREAARLADKILALLAEPVQLDEGPWQMGVSIGISLYPADATDLATLLSYADRAMYAAKRAGKNRYAFYGPVPA
ncbi:sensor domain-containing diguanylate cyclase [Ectothiorhodospiraceae bacterium 2226]|nr:sensor domain-containing diguanylate cyclase [Ectothiorhodospiraceae bacterium 2226]